MRTVRGLFARLCEPEHLERAALATVRGKRRRPDVAWFLFCIEDELEELRQRLVDGSWRPAPFRICEIRDPKPRCIAQVPIFDRVLHAALVMLMEPVFLRRLRPEAFACRAGFARYVDDHFFFADCRSELLAARRLTREWLDSERGLRWKHPEARVLSCRGHLDALGYEIRRAGIRARPRALRRLQRRVGLHLDGQGEVEIERSLASTTGVVLFG